MKATASKTGSAPVDGKRERLSAAIRELSASSDTRPGGRVALAEAEFRLAVLPGVDPAESIELLRQAIAHDPVHPKHHFHLGLALHRTGDCRGAVYAYRSALQLAPSSHRTLTHLALALVDAGDAERKLGAELFDALSRDQGTREILGAVDQALKAYLDQPSGQRPQAARKKAAGAPPAEPCRWEGIQRLALVQQAARPKLQNKQIDEHLDRIAKSEDAATDVALACVELLLGGEPVEAIRRRMRVEPLQSHQDHPAVALLAAALDLASQSEPRAFVAAATAAMRNRTLPAALVCWLHFALHGPSSALGAAEALALFESYEPDLKADPDFAELRIALLDGYARNAWGEGHYRAARLLWNEVTAADPHRIAAAHNLALLAARARLTGEYAAAWDRAAAVRYLQAASAGDIGLGAEDRRLFHLSLSQQVIQRYGFKGLAEEAQTARLKSWIDDRDAVETYLREWDLYYLASRLRFRSPVHLLGIPNDASPEVTVAARDTLTAFIRRRLGDARWPGAKVFVRLALQAVEEAYKRASVNVERARDPYYLPEKAEAELLVNETIERATTLNRLILAILQTTPAPGIERPLPIGRSLFTLPWKVLGPICASRGFAGENGEPVLEIFENYFLGAAFKGLGEPSDAAETERLAAMVEECCRLAPRPEESGQLRRKLAIAVDNKALGLIPESERQPKDVPEARRTLASGRKALERFPRACGLRLMLAGLLKQIGEPAEMEEAALLLDQGLPLALDTEQKAEMEKLRAEIGDALPKSKTAAEVRAILEAASKEVSSAIEQLQRGGADAAANVETTGEHAMRETTRAERMAKKAGLDEMAGQADALRRQIEEVIRKVRRT